MTKEPPVAIQFFTERRQLHNFTYFNDVSGLRPAAMIAHIITGMQLAHQPLLAQPEQRPGANTKRWDYCLPRTAAERLADFYERTQAQPDGSRYECHSLPPYVWGAEQDILPFAELSHQARRPRSPVPSLQDLYEGQPYAAIDSDGNSVHSLLGAHPGLSLSVLGPDREMALTPTATTLAFYGAVSLHEVAYEAKSVDPCH